MSTDRIRYLLQRFFQQDCTPQEKEELALWIDMLQNDEEWRLRLEEIWNEYEPGEKMDALRADAILEEIISEKGTEAPVKVMRPYYRRWRVAAAVTLALAASVAYTLHKQPVKKEGISADIARQKKNIPIPPGGNKAILTLANGQTVVLDSAGNGALVQQGNTQVVKVASGLLAYQNREAGSARQQLVHYNTITTPRGGQYQVILPDGSKVWLNAASSLHFPTAFAGKQRRVEVSGEAYFEIAENAAAPFIVGIVSSGGQKEGTVQVLGTHFNINAYGDEPSIRTTLLEGKIKIGKVLSGGGIQEGTVLSPGEQAVMNRGGGLRVEEDVNLNGVVAWKNGLFEFEGDDIESVMRQLSRWYDVDIRIQGNIPDRFTGSIPRNITFSRVFEVLQKTGSIHYRIENREIIVSP